MMGIVDNHVGGIAFQTWLYTCHSGKVGRDTDYGIRVLRRTGQTSRKSRARYVLWGKWAMPEGNNEIHYRPDAFPVQHHFRTSWPKATQSHLIHHPWNDEVSNSLGNRNTITILKTNTPYPSRKIRRIRACTHQRPQRNEDQYAINMAYSLPLNTAYRSSVTESESLCVTRSLTNELFTPYREPEREFRSSRRHFKTLNLDELRSPDFNLLSNQEYSEEEVAETMTETMELYMSKTRADYGSGVARPKIEDRDNFELKGQFLKELRTNTFSGSDHEDVNEHIEKLIMHRLKIGRKSEVNEKFAAQMLDANNTKGNPLHPRLPTKRRMENPRRSLLHAICFAFRNQGASIKTLEIQIGQMSKSISATIEADPCPIRHIGSSQYAVSIAQNHTMMYETRQTTILFPSRLNGYYCEENKGSYGPQFIGASVSVMPLLTYLNLGLGELAHTKLTVELADRTVKYPKGIAKNVLVGIGKFTFLVDFIILDMPEDIKVPLILGRPFLSTARAKIDVYKRKITLRVKEERIVFTKRMELDLEARLMRETLVLNRSLDPFLEDHIKLNDLNEPSESRRNQGDDLMPTIEEGEVIEEFRTRDDELNVGIDDLLFIFHNSIMKEKLEYKGNNAVGALMNIPICVGTFFVMTDFAVLENMDAYRDEGMGDDLGSKEISTKLWRIDKSGDL
ncbi:putative reverse transcriptase domain-containing protein [Tanacetum coccineum]